MSKVRFTWAHWIFESVSHYELTKCLQWNVDNGF